MSSCYSNPSPTFQPAMRIISSITSTNPAVVTTSINHDYVSGEIIRLIVPNIFGMTQANNRSGEITVINDTSFSIKVDALSFDAFSIPSPLPSAYTCAQTIPLGEIASTLSGSTRNVL